MNKPEKIIRVDVGLGDNAIRYAVGGKVFGRFDGVTVVKICWEIDQHKYPDGMMLVIYLSNGNMIECIRQPLEIEYTAIDAGKEKKDGNA